MGWTGCFPRGDSLQRLPRSNRRSSPWTQPPRSRWPRTASTSARRSVVGFDMRAYSHQGHGPRADQPGRIHISDSAFYAQSLLRRAAGPYMWVMSGRPCCLGSMSALPIRDQMTDTAFLLSRSHLDYDAECSRLPELAAQSATHWECRHAGRATRF